MAISAYVIVDGILRITMREYSTGPKVWLQPNYLDQALANASMAGKRQKPPPTETTACVVRRVKYSTCCPDTRPHTAQRTPN